MLEVIEMGRAFQESLLHLAAAESHTHSTTSSSSSSFALLQRSQAAQIQLEAVVAALEAAAKVQQQSDPELGKCSNDWHLKNCKNMLELQLMQQLHNSPAEHFQNAFSYAGQQSMTPWCLHPQQQQQQQEQQQQDSRQQQQHAVVAAVEAVLGTTLSPAARAAAAAAALGVCEAAAATCVSGLEQGATAGQVWTHIASKKFQHWCRQQQQQQQATASSNGGTAAAAADADEGQLQSLVSEHELWATFLKQLHELFVWQCRTVTTSEELMTIPKAADHGWNKKRFSKLVRLHQKANSAKAGKGSEAGQQDVKPGGKGAKKKQSGKSAAAAAAAGASRAAARRGKHADDDFDLSSDDDFYGVDMEMDPLDAQFAGNEQLTADSCSVCAAEQAASAALEALRGATSSSSSGQSPAAGGVAAAAAGGGLYGNLPVSWSDPCLMRRLLWELLGKLKPSAQQWFKHHTGMCPHRGDVELFAEVVVCLVRHVWAPPGEWDGREWDVPEQALLLPRNLRLVQTKFPDAEETTARESYAGVLNAGFATQGAHGQAAAVLSLQVLLSLDPHGARAQPKPELLFYTPAGFHAAVCKTLMQAVSPGHWGAASCSVSQQQQQQQQQQQAAVVPPWRRQQLTGQQQQQHPLQAWSCAAFPAWYVWWHIGLLAYHQQQQQQHNTGNAAAAAVGCIAGSSSSSSSSGGDGGGSGTAVQAQELYNSPDARYAFKLACVDMSVAQTVHLTVCCLQQRVIITFLPCP
jgi:hypothetical protein